MRSGRGEIDLLIRDRGTLVAVEVKTRVAGDPRLQFTEPKIEAVRAAMGLLDPSPSRLDLVTVAIKGHVATIRWFRAAG